MKNLKKVLSLALVLVMACGLFVTASASDYTDSSNINYQTAVDVLSGVGILEGYADGSFLPKGDVNRAQAAKIVAYLLLGKESADALSTNVSPFADVPAGHWAAGYIQYCANQGIIDGVGNNLFKPTNKVTTAQIAKMLLVALGYGVNDEFVGNEWKTQVIKYASRVKLFDGNYAANPDAYANREESALYAFNAMFADKVVYSALFGDYLNSVAGSGSADSLGSFADDYRLAVAEDVTVNYDPDDGYIIDAVGYVANNGSWIQIYPTIYGIEAQPSDIGRTVDVWYQIQKVNNVDKAVAITGITYADTVIATKYDGDNSNTAVNDPFANWTTRGNAAYVAQADNVVTWFVNGNPVDANAVRFAKGDKVELIDTNANGRIDRVLVTTYNAAALTADPTTATNFGVTKVTIADITVANGSDNFAQGVDVTRVSGYENLKAGDVVYYTYNNATQTYYLTKATAVVGQKTAYVGAPLFSMTFGGATYTQSGKWIVADKTIADIAFNTDATIYLDAGGYVISYKETVAALNYAVLDAIAVVPGAGVNPQGYVEARVVLSDGTASIVKVTSLNDGTTTHTTTAAINGAAVTNSWYSYVVDATGNYMLTAVAARNGGNTIDNTKAQFDGVNVANSNTVFVVKYNNGVANAFTCYTGYAALPKTPAGETVTVSAIVAPNGITTYAYIDASGFVGYGATTSYAFISNATPTLYAAGVIRYNSYMAVVNGAAGNVNVLEGGAGAGTVGIYTVTYDTNGYAKLAPVAANDPYFKNFAGAAPAIAANGVIAFKDADKNITASFAYNASTVAYMVNGITGAVTTGTVENIAIGAVKNTSLVLDTNGAVKEIYVIY